MCGVKLANKAINQPPPPQKWYVVYVPEKLGTPIIDHKYHIYNNETKSFLHFKWEKPSIVTFLEQNVLTLFMCSFFFNTVAFVDICHHHRHEYGTDSVSNLLMTWCVVTGVCVRARTTVTVIHRASLRMAAVGGGEQVLTDAEFVRLYYGSVWVGGLWVMSSPDDADVTGSYCTFSTEKKAVELPGCDWTPSSGSADQLSCRASVCF